MSEMGAEPKKLSFGFKKTAKPPLMPPIKAPPKQDEPKQFIECLEGKSIKVIGGDATQERAPLVIPLKPNDKTTTAASLLRIAREVEAGLQTEEAPEEPEPEPLPAPENETLEERAARELLNEARKAEHAKKEQPSDLVIAAPQTLQGQKESTLEDYENIPISQFGTAMLRGMGWTPGKGTVALKLPELRPKGMGLGADKTLLKQINGTGEANKNSQEETLKIVKGVFVKFVSGKRVGVYGQISGFDEDSGRIIVKTALTGENLNVNEFAVTAVNKSEYQKFSKVLNVAKYDEYKRKDEDGGGERIKSEADRNDVAEHKRRDGGERVKTETDRRDDRESRHRSEYYRTDRGREENDRLRDDRSRHRREEEDGDGRRHKSHKSERRDRRKPSESDSSDDDRGRKDRSNREKKREERKRSETSSDSSEKPSRDKKRKGKKKRRDRSRSRNNRRH